MDVLLWRLVEELAKFHSQTLKQEEIKEVWDAEDLVINFKGEPQSGEDYLSSYLNNCLILLSVGELQDDLKITR